ncbi:ABC transporter substrate-binding protein [Paenibacillus rhizophilus]|uniref:ABC transporter substrate-binding protein n=2 Tax=Paenibacillus rhizophilus TaxID=1850366 RepID=A0A3N9P5N9_9BACL|nr:ABC transporter substrate-binding protein [Paenibacillus rhizophilus]
MIRPRLNPVRRRLAFALLITVLLIFSAGCGSDNSGASSKADSDGLFPIRVATQTGFNEITIADELGYFKEEGIKIEYTGVLGKGVTEYQLIAQGINDAFISGHPPNVAQARLAGLKMLAVAPGMVDNKDFPHVRYLVQDSSPIRSLNDIVGKKVAISNVGPCTDGYLKYYLSQQHLSEDVNWTTLPAPGQQEQSLEQGLVDVTTSHPPFAGIALKQKGIRQIATSWDILHSPGAGLSVRGFSEDFIKQHPDVVKGFTKALAKVRPWVNSHQEEAKQIVAKQLKLEPEDLSVFWYDEDKDINQDYIKQWFDISEQIGLWKKGDIQPADIFTNEYAPQ